MCTRYLWLASAPLQTHHPFVPPLTEPYCLLTLAAPSTRTPHPPLPAQFPQPSDDEGAGEELDPRVEGALGDLNQSTDDINVCEKALEDAKKMFRERHTAMQMALEALHAKCGKKAIERARPYHEALFKARKVSCVRSARWLALLRFEAAAVK